MVLLLAIRIPTALMVLYANWAAAAQDKIFVSNSAKLNSLPLDLVNNQHLLQVAVTAPTLSLNALHAPQQLERHVLKLETFLLVHELIQRAIATVPM